MNCKELTEVSKLLGMENLSERCSLLTLENLIGRHCKNAKSILTQYE